MGLPEPHSSCYYENVGKDFPFEFAEPNRIKRLGECLDYQDHISHELTGFDSEAFIEAYSRPRTIPLVALRELPHRRKCRICRSSFRSKRARDGYCASCRQIIDDRTMELDRILASAEHGGPAAQQGAIEKVRVLLQCNLTIAGAGLPCEWEGNAARYWPKTTPGVREVLRDFVERAQRHLCQHCFPGRFGWAARKRLRKQLERLCHLPEGRQPEWVKWHNDIVRRFEEQGITVSASWPLT
jgi:hypothetical protein